MPSIKVVLRFSLILALTSVAACGPATTDETANDDLVIDTAALTFAAPMPVPPVLQPTSSDATTDRYDLTVRPGTAQIRAGAATPIVGFNGLYPGPTIIAQKGRSVLVTTTNGWNENISIHNHGHKVAASSDGHPIDYIIPGASKTYTYPNDQRASTYWYHDHTMDLTGPHVYKGIEGFYLIHDPAEDALNLPSGQFDVPMLIQDKQFTATNALVYSSANIRQGFLGNIAVVNGVEAPFFNVATHKYRFRVLNGSNVRVYQLRLQSGRSFRVIGSDGGLLAAPITVTSLSVAPAERYDIVVDFSTLAVGTTDALLNADTTAPAVPNLVQFRVTTAVTDSSTVPAALSSITRFQASQATATVNLTFGTGNQGIWTINGRTYDPARIDVTSHLGPVYIWNLVNNSREMHPFHKHLVEFQILDINGRPPPPEQLGWKDTVQVPPGSRSTRIIFRNEGFTGTYVYHCHKLEHEDHRMMAQESVTP
jgi:FtsP/CotA-like multicopper oxidase with cupredoxin domain